MSKYQTSFKTSDSILLITTMILSILSWYIQNCTVKHLISYPHGIESWLENKKIQLVCWLYQGVGYADVGYKEFYVLLLLSNLSNTIILDNVVTISAGHYLKVGTSFLCTELALVRTVSAVILRVALPGGGNAASVVAEELWGGAGHIDTTGLVTVVTAVVLWVTAESGWYAAPGRTLEFSRRTCRLWTIHMYTN